MERYPNFINDKRVAGNNLCSLDYMEIKMSDPFQNVDNAGISFAQTTAETMELRQSEPIMESLVLNYLKQLEFKKNSLSVEIGCGAGSISRRISKHVEAGQVLGFDPSANYIEMAKKNSKDYNNLSFFVTDGKVNPLEDGAVDNVIFHTVLSHVPEPNLLVAEAYRLLRSGGKMVICDADFSKATLKCCPDDPLAIASASFVRSHVTDPHLLKKIKPLISDVGFKIEHFEVTSRVVTGNGMRMWVEAAGKGMLERNEIGSTLADALLAEYDRRVQNETLYGFLPFFTFIVTK